MFDADIPIIKKSEDLLGRSKFAIDISKSIISWKNNDNLVIGLFGEWGSGKSSIINMMKEYLDSLKNERPEIIKFNPWIFPDQEKLFENFFKQLTEELKLTDNGKYKKLAEKLELYSSAIEMVSEIKKSINLPYIISLISMAGLSIGIINKTVWGLVVSIVFAISGIPTVLNSMVNFFNRKFNFSQRSLSELKKSIEKELNKQEKKFLIIIDDIDRLDGVEIKQLFKLVRATANFKNIIYLLAFDRQIVENAFNQDSEYAFYSSGYLNKIIQVPFDIPVLPKEKIREILFKELSVLYTSLPENATKLINDNSQYRYEVIELGILRFFKDIRDVKRYINCLDFNIKRFIIDGHLEVNPIDFFAVEAIRVFAPHYYKYIYGNKELYISISNSLSKQEIEYYKTSVISAVEATSTCKYIHNMLLGLTVKLFPKLENILNNGAIYGDEWYKLWTAELRICSDQKFDKYFTLEPLNTDMVQAEIKFYKDNIFSKSAKDLLIRANSENKLNGVIDLIYEELNSENFQAQENDLIEFIQVLFEISDCLPKPQPNYLYTIDYEVKLILTIPRILSHIHKDKQYNFQILEKLFINAKNGIYSMLYIIIQLTSNNQTQDTEYWNLFEGNFDKLVEVWIEKVKPKIEDYSIIGYATQNYKFRTILHKFKELNDDNTCFEKFIITALNDKKLLLNIVYKYVESTFTYYSNNTEETKCILFDELGNIFELEKINCVLMEQLNKQTQIYNENRALIDLYIDQYSHKDNN